MGAHSRPLVAGPVATQRLEHREPAAARPALELAAVFGVEVYKWIVLVLSISSDFWLRWLVHEP
jgi:hypothetical protein